MGRMVLATKGRRDRRIGRVVLATKGRRDRREQRKKTPVSSVLCGKSST